MEPPSCAGQRARCEGPRWEATVPDLKELTAKQPQLHIVHLPHATGFRALIQKPLTIYGVSGKLNEPLNKKTVSHPRVVGIRSLRTGKALERCLASSQVFSNIHIIAVNLLNNLMKQVSLLTLFLQERSHSYYAP